MVSKNVFFCMIFSGVGFKRIQCIDFIILSLQYWLCGFSSKKVRIFKFMYFLQSKIRNLTATKKHYQHCNVFRKSFFFFVFVTLQNILTHSTFFFSTKKITKTNFSLYVVRIFFVTQRKLHISIRFLYILFLNTKRTESGNSSQM